MAAIHREESVKIRIRYLLALCAIAPISATAIAQTTRLSVGPDIVLSTQSPDYDIASKAKIARLGNGILAVVYTDGASDELVYDTEADLERESMDVFVTTCNSNAVDCSDVASWTSPSNVSRSAGQSSISSRWRGPSAGELPFYGDCSQPQIFASGTSLVLAWESAFCPGGQQRTVSYAERGERAVPYHCIYVSRSIDSGMSWSSPQQLTSGRRDATQHVPRGNDAAWIMTWQEDPQGLQLGEAEGPGEGASGAHVTGGTDVWYTYLTRAAFDAGTAFPSAIRLTDNFTEVGTLEGGTIEYELGSHGASRPNVALAGPTVLVAYEETRGPDAADGKSVRYHSFRFDAPPSSCADDPSSPGTCLLSPWEEPLPHVADPRRAGCIVSDPRENARRVRFVAQNVAASSGTRLFMFWRQGSPTEGGPADVVGRTASGFAPADFDPPLAIPAAVTVGDALDGCYVIGDEAAGTGAHGNSAGLNLTASTVAGGDLGAATSDDLVENARAHRAILDGDTVFFGYTYAADGAAADTSDADHYNFYVRRSLDGGQTWDAPVDLSSATLMALATSLGLSPRGISVREPRLVRTPGQGPGCPSGDPSDPTTTRASDCRASGTAIVAFGTVTNPTEAAPEPIDLDIFITRTTDLGATYEASQALAGTAVAELEAQLVATPDGRTVLAVWNHSAASTGSNTRFAIAIEEEVPVEPDAGPGVDAGHSDDAGQPEDAGRTRDGGAMQTDAGLDAGTPGADAGVVPSPDGCSCTAAGAPTRAHTGLGLLVLAMVGARLTRRRRP